MRRSVTSGTHVRWHGRLLQRLRGDGDDGVAMLTVLLAMLLVTTAAVTALNYSAHALGASRRAQDYRAAMAAAEAGIDDYRRHLTVDDSYWVNGNTDPSNAAFSADGKEIPGGDTAGSYHYEVLNTAEEVQAFNLIRLKVTGTVNGVERTVVADLRKPGFLKYGLFDMEETVDPAQYADLGYNEGYDFWADRCGRAPTNYMYYYGTPDSPARNGTCKDLYFGPNDVVNGPFHTNDTPMLGGNPQFRDKIAETSWPACDPTKNSKPKCYRQASGGGAPDLVNGYPLVYAPPLHMPPTNNAIRDQADGDIGGKGCLYTGPTQITLNADGTMTVLSPYTLETNPGCSTSTPIDSPQKVSLPKNGVVYVQGIPTDSTDPNHSNIGTCPAKVLGAYPQKNDNVTQNGAQKYDCHAGDLFVEGTLSGRVTMAASNNIIITGDTTYKDGFAGSDVLGLVANNYVTVYHPVHCDSGDAKYDCDNLPVKDGKPLYGIEINAAILSVSHAFTVQNPAYGHSLSTPGDASTTRHVIGAVIESFGAFSAVNYGGGKVSGYSDLFEYDRRLLTLPPPYFLQPVAASWELAQFAEVKS